MEQRIEAISKSKHKDYFFLPLNIKDGNFISLSKITSCQICFPELKSLAPIFPIIFTKNEKNRFKIEVLFSFLKDKNPFINQKGKWLEKYIPVYFRCLPFTLIDNQKKNDKVLSFISGTNFIFDKKAEGGIPFFEGKSISKDLSQIAGTIDAIGKSNIVLDKALDLIYELDLIIEWPINIKFVDGEKTIEGIYKIDFEKLKNLSNDNVIKLHKMNGFEIIYSQLISMGAVENMVRMIVSDQSSKDQAKSLREVVVEKQKIEKDREIDDLVKNLITPD